MLCQIRNSVRITDLIWGTSNFLLYIIPFLDFHTNYVSCWQVNADKWTYYDEKYNSRYLHQEAAG
jgi:hypothetical protein